MSLPTMLSNGSGILKSVAQLLVNSLNDGQTTDTLTNWQIFLDKSSGIKRPRHMEISSISFTNYVKQFHELKCNFCFLYNGSPAFVTIDTDPIYTISSLITELNTKLTAGGYTITVSQSATTDRLIFTETGGNTVQLLSQFEAPFTLVNRINAKLGLIYNNQASFTSAAQEAQIPPRVNQECIYLTTTLSFDSVSASNPNIRNVLLKIPLADIGSKILYQPSTDLIFDIELAVIESIRFGILDEDMLEPATVMMSPLFIEMHFSD